jgi:plastocyanin
MLDMRRIELALGFVSVALGVLAAPAAAAHQSVEVGDDFFTPARVAVMPGDSVTWTNPGSGEAHNVLFEDGQFTAPGTPSTGPWTVTRTFAIAGKYPYHCQVHGLEMSGVVYVNAAGALPPLVALVASPNPVVTGQPVSFDASASTDSSGIAKYQWDLDGSGMFATDTGTTPRVSRSYASAGMITVKVRVTNTLGLSDEKSVSVRVNAPRPAVTEFAATNRVLRTGTTFKYKLSERATVKIDLRQLLPGRRQGKRCVNPAGKVTKAQMCVRAVSRGTLTRASHAGANAVAFSGRIGNQALAPGNYEAVLTATNAAGLASGAKTLTLKVVRG